MMLAVVAMDYRRRLVDDTLDRLLPVLPAIAIQGAKAVGKTATATRRADATITLSRRFEREVFQAKTNPLAGSAGTTLIDEWQREPSSWDAVREAVDDGALPGSFILAGSSAPAGADIHSGAGRIVPVRMRPLSLAERGVGEPSVSLAGLLDGVHGAVDGTSRMTLDDYTDEILASGLPGIRLTDPSVRREQLDAYVEWAIQREFEEQGVRVRRPATSRAWLAAYAAATGTTASYSAIMEAATPGLPNKPAAATTMVYRDVLSRAFLLDSLEPWLPQRNELKRLSQSPKHYLADPAIAAHLIGMTRTKLLSGQTAGSPSGVRDGPALGMLFEHLVVLCVQVYASHAGATVRHFRQRDGRREIDLIVERDGVVVAIEVKLSAAVPDEAPRNLLWLRQTLPSDVADLVIVTTGSHAYRRNDGIAVVPAALLGP